MFIAHLDGSSGGMYKATWASGTGQSSLDKFLVMLLRLVVTSTDVVLIR